MPGNGRDGNAAFLGHWPQAELPSATVALLAQLRSAAECLPPATPAARALLRLGRRLLRPPVIAVLGEFRTGKSSLVSLLLKNSPQIAPLTKLSSLHHAPVLFRYGQQEAAYGVGGDGLPFALRRGQALSRGQSLRFIEAHLPLDCLHHYEILDVPGMADPARDGNQLLSTAAQCANLVVWCTVATQAWKGSEQHLWLSMPRRLQAVSVLAATNKDSLRQEADGGKVLARLRREAAPYFGNVVLVSPVAAQEACKTEPDDPLWEGLPRYLFRLRATEKDRSSWRAKSQDLWNGSGAAALFESLSAALRAVRDDRQRSGSRSARRIAKAALGSAGAGNTAAGIAGAWRATAGELFHTLGQVPVDDALLAYLAGALNNFARNTLRPSLGPVLQEENCAEIGDLFRCSSTDLAEAVEGLSVEAARQQLRAILTQLQEELSEELSRLPSMPEQNQAFRPLFELAR